VPRYSFKCSKCGMIFDHIVPSVHRNEAQVCPGCDGPANRDVAVEYASMGNVDAPCKENTRYSNSMGVNPEQIPAAEKAFPGSEYHPDGRLIIHSRQHKISEMKRRGMIELN
jgi:putative FmdB family regulatory protein